jgi:hypothetical protein
MKRIICLIILIYIFFHIESKAQFTGGSVSPNVGLVGLSNSYNNLLLGPAPVAGTAMTRLYLNALGNATLSIDATGYNGSATSALNFNLGGSTGYLLNYSAYPAQGSGMFHISAASSPNVGIHMSSQVMYFSGGYVPCNGPGCPQGQYQFLGSTYAQGLTVGNNSSILSGYALNVNGSSNVTGTMSVNASPITRAALNVQGKGPYVQQDLALFRPMRSTAGTTSGAILLTSDNTYGAKPSIEAINTLDDGSTSAAAALYLQRISNGRMGVGGGWTIYPGGYNEPNQLLHVNTGNIIVTNSGAPIASSSGVLIGSSGSTMDGAGTSYSWMQSSKGPLLLNPLSGNSITASSNTNNYVAIGFLPSGTELVTLPPAGYNLLVQGKIACEELKVKLKVSGTAWPDYVFAKNYRLMSIDSLSTYIDHNCHLPDVPTTAEVEKNGIMTGEMNAILLKKVEELTLYMIEQNKNSSTQAEQIELLKKQNELLMEQVQLLVQKNK